MSLTISEVGLLRSLVQWRRANGWTYKVAWDNPVCDRDGAPMSEPCNRHEWESPALANGERANVEALVVNGDLWAVNYRADYGDEMAHIKGGRGFLDLAHSLLAAGRESAYDRDEWRVCSGPANKHLPEEYQFPYVFAEEIGSAEDAELELVRARRMWASEESWLESRRNGSSPWVRVPEAGDGDA